MRFFASSVLAIMIASVTAAPAAVTPAQLEKYDLGDALDSQKLEARRTCVFGNIICSYEGIDSCIVPCIANCKCPPTWTSGGKTGRNNKSACGFAGALTGSQQCFDPLRN